MKKYRLAKSPLLFFCLTVSIISLFPDKAWTVEITLNEGNIKLCKLDTSSRQNVWECQTLCQPGTIPVNHREHFPICKPCKGEECKQNKTSGVIPDVMGGKVTAGSSKASFKYQCDRETRIRRVPLLNAKASLSVTDSLCSRNGVGIGDDESFYQAPVHPSSTSLRYTLLLENSPTLHWKIANAKDGKRVKPHVVKLCRKNRSKSEGFWQSTIDEEVRLPPLEKGVAYQIFVVQSDDSKAFSCERNLFGLDNNERYSSKPVEQFPISGLTFELINDNTKNDRLCPKIRKITENTDLKDSDKAYLLAELYEDYKLHSEAISVLEIVDRKQSRASQSPESYTMLSELYRKVGLDWLALDALNRAYVSTWRSAIKPGFSLVALNKDLGVIQSLYTKTTLFFTSDELKDSCLKIYEPNYRKGCHQGFPTIDILAQKPGC
jgi:hypothetical protein